MERTKLPQEATSVTYSHQDEPLVISKSTMDAFLTTEEPANLIALYCFYYYTAKWQKTNQPKATIEYVSNGLHWNAHKVRTVKQELLKLGLIEDLTIKDCTTGKVTGHYVKVNFIWSKNHPSSFWQGGEKNHPSTFPQGGFNHRVVLEPTNALRTNKENALRTNKENALSIISPPQKKPLKKLRALHYLPLAEKISSIVKSTKNIFHTTRQLETWALDICRLVEDNKVTYRRIEETLDWYKKHVGEEYVPVIESGASLREKFLKLENAMKRTATVKRNGKPTKLMQDGMWYYLDEENGNYYAKDGSLYM
jgi:hypothetical protein